MSDPLVIQSHSGPYAVAFDDEAFARLGEADGSRSHYVIDANVARLYARDLKPVLASPSVLLIDASEAAKSLDRFPAYVEHLVARAVRRQHRLVAVGGGVIQDIVCFLAATLLRGLPWDFYPTTLLAQADSCIGSKSSINVGTAKNILGTFTPPARVVVAPHLLETLSEADRRSGIGEMLKVHAIAGPGEFDAIARDYDGLLADRALMRRYIRRSLEIKKAIIEFDEFDRGRRNVMNYGHTFGHAIEAATAFAVPHGIAITIGMDMANYVAAKLALTPEASFHRMHAVLRKNYAGFERTTIPVDPFFSAVSKDKKNADGQLTLILPDANGQVRVVRRPSDARFTSACAEYLTAILRS